MHNLVSQHLYCKNLHVPSREVPSSFYCIHIHNLLASHAKTKTWYKQHERNQKFNKMFQQFINTRKTTFYSAGQAGWVFNLQLKIDSGHLTQVLNISTPSVPDLYAQFISQVNIKENYSSLTRKHTQTSRFDCWWLAGWPLQRNEKKVGVWICIEICWKVNCYI